MVNEFAQFARHTTQSYRVNLTTPQYEITGTIFLPRSMKENRRLTNLLNSDKRFLALTEVTLTDRKTGQADSQTYTHIHVNLASIEIIKPLDPMDEEETLT